MSFSLTAFQFISIPYILISLRKPISYGFVDIMKEVLISFFFTFVLSAFIFMFFENPAHSLLKNLLGLKGRSDVQAKGSKTESERDENQNLKK